MRASKLLFSTVVAIATLAATTTTAQAFVFVNQALDVLTKAPAGEDDLVFTLTEQGVDTIPFDTGAFTTGSGANVSINNNLNDLPNAVGNIEYRLFGEAEFGAVSSNLYDVALSENNQVATFTGARVNPGELFRIERSIEPNSDVDFQVRLFAANETNAATAASVPEPTMLAGLALVGVAGACIRRRRQQITA
ncbi:MAG: PEP-CTERM sorting domain-containing protein [Phormidesmis sp.]